MVWELHYNCSKGHYGVSMALATGQEIFYWVSCFKMWKNTVSIVIYVHQRRDQQPERDDTYISTHGTELLTFWGWDNFL